MGFSQDFSIGLEENSGLIQKISISSFHFQGVCILLYILRPLKNAQFDFAPLQGLKPTPLGRVPRRCQIKEDGNFNHRNTLSISRIKI